MPTLPLGEKLYANSEDVGNTVTVQRRVDVLRDDLGNNVVRFRLAPFADLGTDYPIDGVFRFQREDFIAAVSGGRLFKISSAGVVTEITITGAANGFELRKRASMADFGATAYFANGGRIVKWPLSGTAAATLTTTNAPEHATHVAFFDQYLLAAEKDSQRFVWSDVGLPDVWLGEFATAGVRPDNLVGVYSAFGEIFAPGTETLEYWSDTGDSLTPFGVLSGTLTERGVLAPDSIAMADNTFFFLDTERRVIRLEGRSPRVISNAIDREIQALSEVSDARGFALVGNAMTHYVLTFPTAGRTFVYDYKNDDWSEFSYWNVDRGDREAFLAQCAVYHPGWDKTILGSRLPDGRLFVASTALDVDTDDGAPVVGEVVTGRWDWKAPNVRKRSLRLRLVLKRGVAGLSGDASIQVQFRDNGTTAWGVPIEVRMGIAGDERSWANIARLGRYYSRQWRFLFPSVNTVLVSAEEEVET